MATYEIGTTTWSEVDDNNNQFPPAGWPAGMLPNAVEPTARADKGGVKRFWDRINPFYPTAIGATTDCFLVSPTQAMNGYILYEKLALRPHVENKNTSPTLAVGSFPAFPIKKYVGGLLAAMAPGDIQPTRKNEFYWDGVQFILDVPDTSYFPRNKVLVGSGAYTTLAGDSGIMHQSTAATVTIPAYSSVPYRMMHAITLINYIGAGNLSVTVATSDTLINAADGATGTRVIGAPGIATLTHISPTEWLISGTGIS